MRPERRRIHVKCYIAGPMSGVPQFNFPAFDAAAADLRSRGYDIVSPAELDDEEVRAEALASPDGKPKGREHAAGQTWGDFLARDVKLIADDGIKGIIFLPNWWKSRGARLEAFVGLLCGLKFAKYAPDEIGGVTPMGTMDVMLSIGEGFKP